MNTTCNIFLLFTFFYFNRAEQISNTTIVSNPEETKNPTKALVKRSLPYPWWEDYTECGVQEVCLEDAEHCESNVTIGDLEKEEELVIIDLTKEHPEEEHVKINHGDVRRKIDQVCDIAFVTNSNEKNCMMIRTPNRCKWNSELTGADLCSIVAIMNSTFIGGDIPKDCSQGPGWRGEIETIKGKDGTYKLNWASLVKNPRCVRGIQLVDEEANLGKYFWGTFNDVPFPIKYLKSTCKMKIRISYYLKYAAVIAGDQTWGNQYSTTRCFEMNTKVDCVVDSSSRSMVAIICAAVLVIAVVIAVIVILIVIKKQRVEEEKPREEEEQNDQYGTYSDGVEYNTANDDNPRYNEDGGKDDAVVTDENIYYQLATTTNRNPRDNGRNNCATSANGNIYYQL